jgi:anti-sigma B factor antagonist
MPLEVSVRPTGQASVIDLRGKITLGEAATSLRETVKSLLAQGVRHIVINLADVSYVDSAGLGELIGIYTTIKNAGGSVKLLHLQKKIKDLLQITRLYTVFDVYDDEAAALTSFGQATGA